MIKIDVLIIGAGAAGLFCGVHAGKRGRAVKVIDHANKPGKKILMSGGGRCNFTNLLISPEKYISNNPHFCKSALSRYTQWDFIELVKKHNIPYHEKTLGQLFCDNKSKEILDLLLKECHECNVKISLEESVLSIEKGDEQFTVRTNKNTYQCQSLVIATGGLSIPTLGATPFGYKVAEQFNIPVLPVRAGLVPLTWNAHDKERFGQLAGISQECVVSTGKTHFRENILFTHKGLSGPAMLQISSYWICPNEIQINLCPGHNVFDLLIAQQKSNPKMSLKNFLESILPKRLIPCLWDSAFVLRTLANLSHAEFERIANQCHQWTIIPNGTEGYRTAEVTLGGVDVNAISSKTMQANDVPGLFFIGEVLNVSGWLGGYNFQWAWSSAFAAGQSV